MNYIEIIGLAAAIFTTVANIPQTYKIIKEKNTSGISTSTYIILLIGNSLWLSYGILNTDLPLILANTITVLSCLSIITLNVLPQKAIEIIHKKVLPEKIKKEVRDKSKKK